MSGASELKGCPKCGAPIPAEAPQGLCPQCLLAQASFPTEAGTTPSPVSHPPTHEELTAAFPQLEILGLIGHGGMGFVFKARQPKLERFVALKILPQSLAADPAFAERFTREGRMLARLNHPNIVTIHDFGQANGFFYLVMEFVDGVNLRQAMKVGRFTPEQALAVVPRICDALQFAHSEGILHRDIKPENILLDAKGRVKIADFGIAKIMGAETGAVAGQSIESMDEQNATGIIGTPRYMAPEQLEHPQDVDQRADIYSLGVVFYEMLTGELPLGRFAPPSAKSSADPRLDEVVLRALEKEPNRRTQSAGEVKTQVETIAGSKPSPAISVADTAAGAWSRKLGFQEIAPHLRRGALASLFTFLLIIAATAIISFFLPKTYLAVARVEISAMEERGYDPYRIQAELDNIRTPDFLRKVAASLNLGWRSGNRFAANSALENETVMRSLRDSLQIRSRNNTPLIELGFYSESANDAAEIANKIAEIYCALPPGNRGRIVDLAIPPSKPVRPNIPLNIAIGAVAGAGLGILMFILTGAGSFLRSRVVARQSINSSSGQRSIPSLKRLAAISVLALLVIGLISGVVLRMANSDPRWMKRSRINWLNDSSAPAIGSLHLIGAGAHSNLVMARVDSPAGYPLHQIIARFAGPPLQPGQWDRAHFASLSTLAPAPEEKLGEGWRPEPVESTSISKGLPGSDVPHSSEIFECPNECQLQFALANEDEATEAARQIGIALAKPTELFSGKRIKLFQVGEREAWLEIREFQPTPGKLSFIGHSDRNVGRSPVYLTTREKDPFWPSVNSAVISIPPAAELDLSINLSDTPTPLFSGTLKSETHKPGLYWLTWYAVDASNAPAHTGPGWEIFIHDARTARELRHLTSVGKPATDWQPCFWVDATNELPGRMLERLLFYAPDASGTKLNPRNLDVHSRMTMRASRGTESHGASRPPVLASPTPQFDLADSPAPIPPEKITDYENIVGRLDLLYKKEEDLLTRFTDQHLLVKNVRKSIAETEKLKKNLEQQIPRLLTENSVITKVPSASTPTAPAGDFSTERSKGTNTPTPRFDLADSPAPIPPEKITDYENIVGRLDLLYKRERDLLTRFTDQHLLVKNVRKSIAETEKLKKNLEQQIPRLLTENSVITKVPSASTPTAPAGDFSTERSKGTNTPAFNSESDEIARLKLNFAEEKVKEAEKKFAIGMMDKLSYEKAIADRDILLAEMKADAVEVARIKFRIAESELSVAEKRRANGVAGTDEYENAKLARDVAEVSFRHAQNAKGK